MNTRFHLNKFLATGVGSLPHTCPKEACDVIFSCLKDDIPYWPQLPRRDFKENMYVQYSYGLPGVVIDEAAKQIYIDTQKNSYNKEVESAYEHYLAEDFDYFAISQDYAAGLYEFLHRLSSLTSGQYIKGQTIGPISFGLTVTDQNKKASIYNQEFCDVLVKVLAMKTRWQIRKLKSQIPSSKTKIIICIDEPYLVSIGSSFFNIKGESVVMMLNELITAVHQEGAFAGIHCCGNTDWPLVLKTDIDILSFDGYNYRDTLFLYSRELDNFLKRGGTLAWGIVPTQAEGELPQGESLVKKMGRQITCSLVTPSCGLSGVPLERAKEALTLTVSLARRLSSGKP